MNQSKAERLPPQSEKVFRKGVVALAKLTGWRYYGAWLSLHSPQGYPDLTLCREKPDGTAELIYLELKSERGLLTPAQEEWLNLLGKVPGVKALCFRPSQWETLIDLLR